MPVLSDKDVLRKLETFGRRIYYQIEKGIEPHIYIPVRTLANTVWDKERKMLILGPKKARRNFFDIGESKRFMQTLLMLSIIIKARREGDYPTIRDLYYTGKHTIEYIDEKGRKRAEETWNSQNESNAVIQDIEVATGLLREHMGIMHDAKGKIVGNVIIRSKGYEINLARLGSGSYAIPPNADKLEIVEVDADYVLVIEKDAIFERLNEEEFWKKHNCVLITGKGQPDRSTRRMVRRLWEEFGLPVYVLTDCDSIPQDEVVIVRDLLKKEIKIAPIGELVKQYINLENEKEFLKLPWEVPSFDIKSGKIEWKPIEFLYRHRISGKLLKIKVRGRGTIKVTPAHSLFVFRDCRVEIIPAKDIKPGDYIVVADNLPSLSRKVLSDEICVGEIIKKHIKNSFRLKRIVLENEKGETQRLFEIDGEVKNFKMIYPVESKKKIYNKIRLNEDFAWLLGLFTAEGTIDKKDVRFHLGASEKELIDKTANIIEKIFGIKPLILKEGRNGVRIIVTSSLVKMLFESLGFKNGARKKRVPNIILQAPQWIQLHYLKGLIDGDGYLDTYENIVYSTSSSVLAKQVTLILLSLNINPTVIQQKEGILIRLPRSSVPQYLIEFFGLKKRNIRRISPVYGIPVQGSVKSLLIWLTNNGFLSYSSVIKKTGKQRLSYALQKVDNLPSKFEDVIKNLKPVTEGDVSLAEVLEVSEENYEGDVYDFSVPFHESFIGGYGIVFHNSYGFYIYSVYKSGSISLSYESERLATPSARFIGVMVTDIEEYKIPRNYIIKATDRDIKRAKELMRYPWFRESKAWRRQLKRFISKKEKVEIEALSGHGFKFLTQTYIPEKISEKKWIE